MRSGTLDRVILIVMDSVGAGALPDAARYGDEGSNTLANTARAVGGLKLPNLGRLGLGNVISIEGVPPTGEPSGSYGKMAERSAGKDTTVGHWEMMGVVTKRSFPTYPKGFPPVVMNAFTGAIGRPVLGNKPASGTEIIKELGEQHLKTGYPIVYTSADSVFQIAAHEDVIPVEELYRMCETARRILVGKHRVDRVIARPFVGRTPADFVRTPGRKDFGLPPPQETVLDYAAKSGFAVCGVGKVAEMFAMRGVTEFAKTSDNMDGIDHTLRFMEDVRRGIIFTDLTDFDALWGHRNDPAGYARCLRQLDRRIPEVVRKLKGSDGLILTADHGCDPTTPSTDHSREYVPVLVHGPRIRSGVDLGVRRSFADLGRTLADLLGFAGPTEGTSFAQDI